MALRDPRVGVALASIHRYPETDWNLETLAKRAAMSRTAFATRFAELVGEPPLHRVARCRMNRAMALLTTSDSTTGEIAARVGYDSELGFSRAFKRFVGTSPAAHRQKQSTRQRKAFAGQGENKKPIVGT